MSQLLALTILKVCTAHWANVSLNVTIEANYMENVRLYVHGTWSDSLVSMYC